MKTLKSLFSIFYPLFLACSLLFFAGCGYVIQKAPSVDSVRLGRIENRTFEPKLEDRLYEALARALMKNGIRIDEKSAHTIKGVIDEFKLRSRTEKEGITVQYEIIIKGKFFLEGPEGQRELRNRGLFIVSFTSEDTLNRVRALKEEATVRALSDMAEEIAASILY